MFFLPRIIPPSTKRAHVTPFFNMWSFLYLSKVSVPSTTSVSPFRSLLDSGLALISLCLSVRNLSLLICMGSFTKRQVANQASCDTGFPVPILMAAHSKTAKTVAWLLSDLRMLLPVLTQVDPLVAMSSPFYFPGEGGDVLLYITMYFSNLLIFPYNFT